MPSNTTTKLSTLIGVWRSSRNLKPRLVIHLLGKALCLTLVADAYEGLLLGKYFTLYW
jgi:hypothetical protein